MTKEITVCCKCQKEVPTWKIIDNAARRADAAGQMETYSRKMDICHKCAVIWLQAFLNAGLRV